MTGQWTGNWMMFSLSANVDQNQGLQRNFMVQNDQNHECTVTWTDENGRTGIFATLRYAQDRRGKDRQVGQCRQSAQGIATGRDEDLRRRDRKMDD